MTNFSDYIFHLIIVFDHYYEEIFFLRQRTLASYETNNLSNIKSPLLISKNINMNQNIYKKNSAK